MGHNRYNFKFRLPSEDWLESDNIGMELLLNKMKENYKIYHNLSEDDINITPDIIYNLISRRDKARAMFKNKCIIRKINKSKKKQHATIT